MRNRKRIGITALAISASMVLTSAGSVCVMAETAEDFAEQISSAYRETETKYRPYARWWLAEGSHTDETLREAVKDLYDAGYGGVEFVTLMRHMAGVLPSGSMTVS